MDRQELLYNILKKARDNRPDLISEGTLDCNIDNGEYLKVIFSKEFAIAYWGDSHAICKNCGDLKYNEIDADFKCRKCNNDNTRLSSSWQYYQHQMLDEIQDGKDFLKYLEKFL